MLRPISAQQGLKVAFSNTEAAMVRTLTTLWMVASWGSLLVLVWKI